MAELIAAADSAFLIALLDPADFHHEAATKLSKDYDGLRIHPINLAEVLVGIPEPLRLRTLDLWRDGGVAVATPFSDIEEWSAREYKHSLALAKVRSTYRVKMPDACALLVAQALDLPLLTFVNGLAKAARRASVEVPA